MRTHQIALAGVALLLASSAPIANAKRRRRSPGGSGGGGGGQGGAGGGGSGSGNGVRNPWMDQPPPPQTPPQTIETKPAHAGEKYNYNQVMYLSMLFYEEQRSGPLPANNRIPWRRDANVNDPVPGGWFDAGDFVKFSWTMAYAATVLAWGFLEYSDAYAAAGEADRLMDCLRWPLDYLMRCHTGKDQFVVQVGAGETEHNYWGRPELETHARPAFSLDAKHKGSEVLAESAAAMAAGYLVFKDHDHIYASELLSHAKALFDTAFKNQGICPYGQPFYVSTGIIDELAYAAAWLHKATGEKRYLDTATTLAKKMVDHTSTFSWENKSPAVSLLMWKLTADPMYKERFQQFMENWRRSPKTPHGLYYYQEWGPLRFAANTAFMALLAADYGIDPKENRKMARSQIHYILGDNGSDGKFSYVIGFNQKYPKAPHHRTASCGAQGCHCTAEPLPFTVYGALVGGPDQNDGYRDDCQNFRQAEIAIDYNAGLQSAVAGLKHLSLMKLLDSF